MFKSPLNQAVRSSGKQPKDTVSSVQYSNLQKEVDYISERLELLIGHIKYENLPHIPKPLRQLVKDLINNGVAPSLSNSMIEDLLVSMKGEDFLNSELLDEKLHSKIKNKLQIAGPLKFNKGCPTVMVIVGPTGVGKTTTLAKIAAMYKYTHSREVALISIDTYRIAAMDQLKAFADIARIPFHAAYDNTDLQEIVKSLQETDLILIDTAGINPRDMKKMVALKETMRLAKADEIHLALSLTTASKDLRNITKSFKALYYNALIYTKLDEAVSFGDILNMAVENEKEISFITNGQNIPDDIGYADRNELAMSILRGKYGVL